MQQAKDVLGKEGEDMAMAYLVKEGFQILERNWKYGHKEIDIVASKNDVIHIVEVKTRTSGYHEDIREALSKGKQKNIIAATDAYIQIFDVTKDISFDLIFIIIDAPTKEQLEYIPNAFNAFEY